MGLILEGIDLGTLLLSPMAGVTDSVYRRLCRRMGAGALCTELVSADGLIRGNAATMKLVEFDPEEHPIAVQLFGSDPEVMADAARKAYELEPDFIDLNFGCPSRKVVKKAAGSALLKDLVLLREIVSAVVGAVRCPVTVKIRAGWDESSLVYVEATHIAAEEGARAVAFHPRTRVQGYSGRADWDRISELVRGSPIPVIGNGDLFEPEDVLRMMEQTGCPAVMIARGAIGNPWIFKRTGALLETGVLPPEPEPREMLEMALLHAGLQVEERGEVRGMREIRRHVSTYTRGLWCGSRLRQAIFRTVSLREMKKLVNEYLDALSRHGSGDLDRYEPMLIAKEEKAGARL